MATENTGPAALRGDVLKSLEWALQRIRTAGLGEGEYFEAAETTLAEAQDVPKVFGLTLRHRAPGSLPAPLQREAAVVGNGLDAEALEQGEPA